MQKYFFSGLLIFTIFITPAIAMISDDEQTANCSTCCEFEASPEYFVKKEDTFNSESNSLHEVIKEGNLTLCRLIVGALAGEESLPKVAEQGSHAYRNILRKIRQASLENDTFFEYINAYNEDGSTPLSLAIESGDMDICYLLIKSGADVNKRSFKSIGQYPINLLLYYQNGVNNVDLSASKKDKQKEKINKKTSPDIFKKLLHFGANILNIDEQERTPLHLAAGLGEYKICKLIIDRAKRLENPNVVLDALDDTGKTALHWAAQKGHDSICRLLVCSGANRKIADKEGNLPLNWAIKSKSADIVRSLSHDSHDFGSGRYSPRELIDLAEKHFNLKYLSKEY